MEASILKQLVVFGLVIGAFPLGMLLRGRRWLPWLLTLYAALPFLDVDGRQTVSFFFDYSYEFTPAISFRGETRGLDVCLIDILSIVLLVALPPRLNPSAFRLARYSYLTFALASVLLATLPGYALFSVWKIFRGYVTFSVITRAMDHEHFGPATLRGFALGLIYVGFLSVKQQYLDGLHQPAATFAHQNTLGMVLCLFFPIFFLMILSERGGKLAAFTCVACALGVMMTLSRSAIAVMAFSAVISAFSSIREPTRRKVWILSGCALLGLAAVAVRGDTLIDRFLNAPEVSGHARDLFEQAAKEMFSDHPLGIGINQYSYQLNQGGYGKQVGVPPGDEGGIVHNIYWLTLAEMGVQGLLSYLLVLFMPMLTAWRLFRGGVTPQLRDFGLGILLGVVGFALQGTLEWASRQAPLTYLFWMLLGFLVGLWNANRRLQPSHSAKR